MHAIITAQDIWGTILIRKLSFVITTNWFNASQGEEETHSSKNLGDKIIYES